MFGIEQDLYKFFESGIKQGYQNGIVRVENVTFLATKTFNFYKGFIHGEPEERVTRGCCMSFLKMYFISSKANIGLFDISSNHKFNVRVLHLLTITPIEAEGAIFSTAVYELTVKSFTYKSAN